VRGRRRGREKMSERSRRREGEEKRRRMSKDGRESERYY